MSDESLNYHHLRLFQAVARAGSASAAARELHLTPQTVGEQVRQLEQALDAVLLERSGRALTPTDTGRMVAWYADQIFELGRELIDVVRQRETERPLRVVIGVSDAMPKLVVSHLLQPIFALGARVRVVCREDRSDRLLAALAVHEVDVVLTDSPTPSHLKLRTFDHFLGSCGATLMAAREIAGALRPEFPASLEGTRLLAPAPGTMLRSMFEAWCERHGVHPVVAAEFDDSALAKEVAATGAGVIVVPSVIADEVAKRHGLERVGELVGVEERFFAISSERRLAHPAVRALAESARSELFSVVSERNE